MHKEGLVRFATEYYKPIDMQKIKEAENKATLRTTFMHLTNYSLNKDHENFRQA